MIPSSIFSRCWTCSEASTEQAVDFVAPVHLPDVAFRLFDDAVDLLLVPQRLPPGVLRGRPRLVVLAPIQLVLHDRLVGNLLALDVQVQGIEEEVDRLRRRAGARSRRNIRGLPSAA